MARDFFFCIAPDIDIIAPEIESRFLWNGKTNTIPKSATDVVVFVRKAVEASVRTSGANGAHQMFLWYTAHYNRHEWNVYVYTNSPGLFNTAFSDVLRQTKRGTWLGLDKDEWMWRMPGPTARPAPKRAKEISDLGLSVDWTTSLIPGASYFGKSGLYCMTWAWAQLLRPSADAARHMHLWKLINCWPEEWVQVQLSDIWIENLTKIRDSMEKLQGWDELKDCAAATRGMGFKRS